jgi:hypothetical protein
MLLASKIYKSLLRIDEKLSKIEGAPSPTAVAGVNGTILAIFIAIVSTYTIFNYNLIQKMEMETLLSAEKINQVQFARNFYRPASNEPNEFSTPENFEDLWKLTTCLAILVSDQFLNPDLFEKIESYCPFPKNLTDRAEKALQLMHFITSNYPFPSVERAVTPTDATQEEIRDKSIQARYEPRAIYFQSIGEVRQWLHDLTEMIYSISPVRSFISTSRESNIIFDSLVEKNKELIKKYKSSPGLRMLGNPDPYYLINDFLKNIQKATNILISTKHYLKRVDKFREGRPSKHLIRIGTVLLGIVFVLGVLYPLAFSRPERRLYLWIPILFYILGYGYIILKIYKSQML